MPTPDETYFNLRRMHAAFALAALGLLAATVWMIAADHHRPWRRYQRQFRDRIEPWLTEAEIRRRQTDAYDERREALTQVLAEALAAVPEGDAVERLVAELGAQEIDADRVEQAYGAWAEGAQANGRRAFFNAVESALDVAAVREERAARRLRERRGAFEAARSAYEAAVGRGEPEEVLAPLRETASAAAAARDEAALAADEALVDHQRLGELVAELRREEDEARRALEAHVAEVERLERLLAEQRPHAARRLLDLPLVDPFGGRSEIEQIHLPGLPLDFHFRKVARFDRCTTCHLAADRALPDVADESLLLGEGELTDPSDLPHPFRSHPRLDLFVGPNSPHPLGEFGCTICHDGQGSATGFAHAAHTPDDPADRARWRRAHGWFEDRHWEYPMLATRFTESRCVQCHHDVVDLEPSRRYPDPPAPKLLRGYHLVRELGCAGCHEIDGYNEGNRRVGPDFRLEPAWHEAALALAGDGELELPLRALARQVAEQPFDAALRQRFVAQAREQEAEAETDPLVRIERERLLAYLEAAPANPGQERKLGPSLRELGGVLDPVVLMAYTAEPHRLRASTRMPRLLGLYEHLEGAALADARRFERVELLGIALYLQTASQPVELPPVMAAAEPPSAERGRGLFRTQGCLACHSHEAFPEGESTFGPDLTGLGSIFSGAAARQWLVSWIRDPVHHNPRSAMPSPLLEESPLTVRGELEGTPTSDPAADLAGFLLEEPGIELPEVAPVVAEDLDELVLMHLARLFPRPRAAEVLSAGLPPEEAAALGGDLVELTGVVTTEDKLRYVGRRAIARMGCYGCHDIPGFEGMAPVGPALSDFGRKPESLLAFEQVHRFVTDPPAAQPSARNAEGETGEPPADGDTAAAMDPYYVEALRRGRREGFVAQKLRGPRTFDYRKAEHKDYLEHLTMGRFALSEEEIEAAVTFVLGLTAQPPAERYVVRPGAPQEAVVEGRKLLDRLGCAECHTLEMERWELAVDPDEIYPPPPVVDFPFLVPQVSAEELAESLQTDRAGRAGAELVGMPRLDAFGEILEDEDEWGEPAWFFTLWEPAVIYGDVWPVGGADVMVSSRWLRRRQPPLGGDYARLLYPHALAEARAAGVVIGELEVWGWLPPPLVHTGAMVEPAWLREYLMDPSTIRPASLMRMPRYALSSAEAARLADYFAAVAEPDFPFRASTVPETTATEADGRWEDRWEEAMRLLVDRTAFCGNCHIVGDFRPGEARTMLGANLDGVADRIRPGYLRRWLANPRSLVPYTGMPANFPAVGEPFGQELFEGSSLEQIDAVADLLRHYDAFLRRQWSVRQWAESQDDPP